MHSQQQIYDSPQQPYSQQPQLPTQTRISIKQTLLQSFTILCQSSPTQSALTQCHKTITHHLKHPQILSILFELILQFSTSNQTLTKLVITQISTYMKRQSSFGYEDRHDRNRINVLFLDFFLSDPQVVEARFKKMLENTYMQFIYATQNVKLREAVVKYVDEKLTAVFATTPVSYRCFEKYTSLPSPITLFIPSAQIATPLNLQTASSLFHLLKCLLIGGNLQTQLMKTILPNCFSIYYQVILQTVKSVIVAVKCKQQGVFVKRYQILSLLNRVDECAKFMELFVLMYSKLDSGKYPELRERILHTREIYRLLVILMSVSTQFTSFQAVESMLTTPLYSLGKQPTKQELLLLISSQIQQLQFEQNFMAITSSLQSPIMQPQRKRTIFNLIQIKKHSVQILIKCIKQLGRKKGPSVGDTYPYLTAMVTALWLKTKTCLILQTQTYLKSTQTTSPHPLPQLHRQLQQLISICTKLLTQTTKLPIMYNMVSPYQNEIIFKLCFPWLISRKEHQKFEAEDYLFFREDLINKQNMSYVENSMGALLEAYLDNVDGVITGIMVNSTGLVTYHLTNNPTILQTLSPQLRTCWAIEFYPISRQIESCLTLISIESYLSLQRNDIALLLQRWLQSHKAFFLQPTNDYRITIQFLLMYSYYVDNFYSNLIQGISSQSFQYRGLHQEVLRFCCYLMKESYDYQAGKYKWGSGNSSSQEGNGQKIGQMLYYIALDCLNNSLNHTELMYALYCNFPPKEELMIPHYMLPYENYPFYSNKKSLISGQNLKKSQDLRSQESTQTANSFLNPTQRKEMEQEEYKTDMKELLVHYRKLGLNKDEYIDKEQILEIVMFLAQNLQTKANVKIIEILIEFMLGYVKQQMKNQGALHNIPIVFRQDIATQLAIKTYSLMCSKPQKFPNRSQFQTKATQLIYVLHTISTDAYYIYSLGMDVVWMNPGFWNFNPDEEDDNVDKLLKCTDLVVRLALKHYSSEKAVNVKEIVEKIANNFCQHSYQYIKKLHKFNIIFGILLNLILLKINPQKMFEFLYLLITEKLMKAELNHNEFYDDDDNDNNHRQTQEIPSSSAGDLLTLAFYLFLTNIYRNPDCLSSEKNFQLLKVFADYLKHFVNAQNVVTQLGEVFGKVFSCCLCIIEKEFTRNTLSTFDKATLQFLWRNILYSGKIYKTELETRIVSLKLLSLLQELIKRNDQQFSLDRLELMFQTACSCVFYSKNKDFLMNNDEESFGEDFDHAGQQEEWQNLPITSMRNDTEMYIEDEVLCLKKVSRQLLQSQNPQIKQWVTKLIESLPVAVRNFVKNKVINYEQEAKQVGLRKIIKVKRPEHVGMNAQTGATTKQEIIKENVMMKQQQKSDISGENNE